jgi:hypothetical protein
LDFKSSGTSVASLTGTSNIFTFAGAGGSGTVELKGITNPTAATSAATKSYVDSVTQGIHWKQSVVAASTANVTLASAVANGSTLDGITLATNDRILLKDQTTGSENGIYIVAASGAPARADDFASGDTVAATAVFIQEGTTNADSGYVVTSDSGSDTVGTDAITFTQFTSLGQITAGSALSKTASTLDVNVDDSSIEVSADALQIKALGVTNAMLAGSIANAKLTNSSVTVTAGDGLQTGGSVALGDSVTVDVDSTVLRTTGGQTVAGTETFSGDIVLSGTTQNNGTITLTDTIAPATTTNKLYGVSGDVYWNGTRLNQSSGINAGTSTKLAYYTSATAVDDAVGLTVSTTSTTDDTLTLYKIVGTDADFSGALEADGNISIPTDTGAFRVGASNDLQLTHNGTLSSITNTTGILRIDNQAAASGIELRLGDAAGSTALDVQTSGGSTLFSINSSGDGTITSSLTVDSIKVKGTTIGVPTTDEDLLTLTANQLVVAGNLDVTNGVDVTGAALTTAVGITNTAGEVLVSGGNVQLNDTIELTLGTDDDLKLVHSGTAAAITNVTGNLVFDNQGTTASTQFVLGTDTSATEFSIQNNSTIDLLKVTGDGVVQVVSATDSSSTSTGSFQTLGGVGIAKELHVGQDVNAVAYNTTSDERLKKDIEAVTDEDVDKLNQLVPKKYHWIDEEKGSNLQYGLIAQQVQTVFPELVGESNNYLNINYIALIPLLLKKIQNLESRLNNA